MTSYKKREYIRFETFIYQYSMFDSKVRLQFDINICKIRSIFSFSSQKSYEDIFLYLNINYMYITNIHLPAFRYTKRVDIRFASTQTNCREFKQDLLKLNISATSTTKWDVFLSAHVRIIFFLTFH